MGSVGKFKNLLKSSGFRVTKARLAVFSALLSHETLVMRELAQKAGNVDRASVYRAVELFEKLGIVQRLNIGWKYKLELTDKFAEHHHHLTCIKCGRTIDMNEAELERLISKLADAHGFRLASHQIEIQGLCSNCQSG